MSLFSPNPTRLDVSCPQDVPGWVCGLFDGAIDSTGGPCDIRVSTDGKWSLARAVINGADAMDDDALRQQTRQAYEELLAALKRSSAPFPVRGWNAIPAIGRVHRRGYDRYMAFNAGRHAAYEACFSGNCGFAKQLPTASAVGHGGTELSISLLGYHLAGQAIENPRQVPAFRYSARYGPTPPSFVRALVLPGECASYRVLVAGTASVVGEDSKHTGDTQRQLQETYRNLAVVLSAVDGGSDEPSPMSSTQIDSTLARYRSARVYVRRPDDMQAVAESVRGMMTGLEELELVQAEICRPELLVEIEGVATMLDGDVT